MITFRHETLRAILEATEDEALIKKGREIGAKIPRDTIVNKIFNFQDIMLLLFFLLVHRFLIIYTRGLRTK
jgi:hypothetical protein